MFQDAVEKVKKKKRNMLLVGVPVMAAVILGVWGLDITGSDTHLPLWMKFGVTGLALVVLFMIVNHYMKFDKLVEAMMQSVKCNTTDDMERLFSQSQQIGEDFFVSDQYVFDLDSFVAFPRSDIVRIERKESADKTRFSIHITYGPDALDIVSFSDPTLRDRAFDLLNVNRG